MYVDGERHTPLQRRNPNKSECLRRTGVSRAASYASGNIGLAELCGQREGHSFMISHWFECLSKLHIICGEPVVLQMQLIWSSHHWPCWLRLLGRCSPRTPWGGHLNPAINYDLDCVTKLHPFCSSWLTLGGKKSPSLA